MAKRRLGIIAVLLCLCVCFIPRTVLAASTSDAKEPILVDSECTLTIFYSYNSAPFPGQTVKLYKVADVSADFQYTLSSPFSATGLILNGVQTYGEWNVIRSTLEAHILADGIAPIQTAVTNGFGLAVFSQLTPGLYFASAVEATQGEETCVFDSALVALPGLTEEGRWQYEVAAAAKPEALPPVGPDEEVQMKVLKLWKGDANHPKEVEVEIFRNGVSVETVVLSEKNQWSYTWSAKESGGKWKVVERNVPAGYTMTVEQKENTFVITNALSNQPTPKPPQTGDTMNVLLYAIAMYVSGAMLIILGITRKRKRHEETN